MVALRTLRVATRGGPECLTNGSAGRIAPSSRRWTPSASSSNEEEHRKRRDDYCRDREAQSERASPELTTGGRVLARPEGEAREVVRGNRREAGGLHRPSERAARRILNSSREQGLHRNSNRVPRHHVDHAQGDAHLVHPVACGLGWGRPEAPAGREARALGRGDVEGRLTVAGTRERIHRHRAQDLARLEAVTDPHGYLFGGHG